MKKERENRWLPVESGNSFVKGYIGGNYKIAFVRILTRNTCTKFSQYFQISWTNFDNSRDFKSFRIYDDMEERDIKNTLKGIPEHQSYNI